MKAIDKIMPSEREKEKVNRIVNKFLNSLDLKDATPIIAGSLAKNTWLKGNHDIDIFVKFPYEKYKDKDISKVLENRLIKSKLIHGSRDYFQIRKESYVFELIPVLDIKNASQATNITDISPLHAEWVIKNLKDPDQARLSKAFCKANNLYGAESYIRGFSGYVLEILTIHYKNFFDFIKNASKWKPKLIMDPMKYYKTKKEVLENISEAKNAPLILVDPVDKKRNAAAALSQEKLESFIKLCKEFLHNPSDKHFEPKKFDINELKYLARENKLLLLEAKPLKGKKDIIGSKLLKTSVYINKKLKENDFKVKDWNWSWDKKAYFWYFIAEEILSETKKHYGPPIKEEKHLEEFRKKWKNYPLQQDGNRVYIELERTFREVKPFIKQLLKEDYITNNVKKIKIKIC